MERGETESPETVLRKRMFEGMVIDGKCLELALEPQNEKDKGWNACAKIEVLLFPALK